MPKDPRINLWFRDHAELNQIELVANKAGLSGPQWIRRIVRQQLEKDLLEQKRSQVLERSILMTRDLLEKKSKPDDVNAALARADRFLKKGGGS